jgi:non-specific serine/threonine protein kinase
VHRDIKPANIFVTPRGQGRFSISAWRRLRLRGPKSMLLVQSPSWRRWSWEDLTTGYGARYRVIHVTGTGARSLTDPRTDLFSLGTVLSDGDGAPPFRAIPRPWFTKDSQPRPVPITREPAWPADSLASWKRLEKDRNLRYQTATDLKTDLIRLKRDIDSGNKRAADSGNRAEGQTARNL